MASIRYKENEPSGEVDPHMDVGRPFVSCATVGLPPFRCVTRNMGDPVWVAQRRAAETALFLLGREKRQAAEDAAAAPAAPAAAVAAQPEGTEETQQPQQPPQQTEETEETQETE